MATRLISVSGTVDGFNLSPKGVPEGLLLVTDQSPGLTQVNFPPELAGQLTRIVSAGDSITVQALPFADAVDGAHPVFELIQLKTKAGQTLTAEGEPEPGVRTRGVVTRINFARRGEPNGGILDNGDFVHLRPHGAKKIGLVLGQELDVEGEVRGGWSGHRVIEARQCNGVPIDPPKKPGGPKHGPPPHERPHHGPPKPAHAKRR